MHILKYNTFAMTIWSKAKTYLKKKKRKRKEKDYFKKFVSGHTFLHLHLLLPRQPVDVFVTAMPLMRFHCEFILIERIDVFPF